MTAPLVYATDSSVRTLMDLETGERFTKPDDEPQELPPNGTHFAGTDYPPNLGDTQFGGVGEYEYPRCSDPSMQSLP